MREAEARELAVPRDAEGHPDLDRIVAALRPLGPVQLLRSEPGAPGGQPWSYVVPATRGALVATAGTCRLRRAGAADVQLGPDALRGLDTACERFGLVPDTPTDRDLPPFTGGLVGALAYDLARQLERVPRVATADRRVPLLALLVAEVVLASDGDRCLLIERPLLPGGALPTAAVREAVAHAPPSPPSALPEPRVAWTSLPRSAYLAAVAAALEHIAAGEVFQLNVTQRLSTNWHGDLQALERALRARSPAPYGAALELPGGSGLAAVSPETFLRTSGRHVVARPIKGTRARGRGTDDASARELAHSAKDRAENVMIVDLVRNDLGRVCRTGSVAVPELAALEGHPTVWHLTSTVTGELRGDVGYAALLRATFPCGSVTGTPKVRALQLIEQLEPVRRGWYCGAFGYLAAGASDLAVTIRTATRWPDGRVDYGAGGGVVADSDPVLEHDESLAKAAAFLHAVGAALPQHRTRETIAGSPS